MIITFGKPATYNKRKIIDVKIEGENVPLGIGVYTIEKYADDSVWTFYRTTNIYSTNRDKKSLLWTDDLRKLKKAITMQLPQYIESKREEMA